jgi:transposase-like protein
MPKRHEDLIQVDSMHLKIEGKRRYLINGIDIKGRIVFSYEYERLNSQNAVDFFERLKELSIRNKEDTSR